jgi:aminoglycoside phosphotransferase (APT) family kinase protein
LRTVSGVAELTRIAQGREAEIFAWDDGTVLRLFRDRRAPDLLEREMAAMEAVRLVVPLVPAVLGRVDIEGRPGLILERIDGQDLLTRVERRPWTARGAGALCGELHAQLHEVIAPAALPGLRDLALRGIEEAGELIPETARTIARERLSSLPDGDRLCHGDFHPGNVLMSSRGPVAIDWTNAVRADAHADVARTLLLMRMGALPPGTPFVVRAAAKVVRKLVLSGYEAGYGPRPSDPERMESWMAVIAALRLREELPGERAALLSVIEQAGSAAGA